jgi:hypothetical protein
MKKALFQCDGKERHLLTFHDDGTVTSSGCEDVTAEAKRISTLIRLGSTYSVHNCAALAALVLYGIPSIFNHPGTKNGDELPFAGWRSLYQRFESLKIVEETVKRERRASRKRRREAAARAAAQLPKGAL